MLSRMSLLQKLFQPNTAMIEALMSKKYNYAARFVPIALTSLKLNKKKHYFLSKLAKFNIVTSSFLKLFEINNKFFFQ